MFEVQTREAIVTRLKNNLKTTLGSEISTIGGTFESDMIQANSYEFEKASAEIDLTIDAAFADTSWGEYLDKRVAESGVIRKSATKASGILKINGIAGSKVISGSLFATADGTNFYTTTDDVIAANGIIEVAIEAQTTGEVGNVDAGTIINIPMSIPGIHSVINESNTHDGYDAETDEALKARYLMKVREPATSGNQYHYKQWALSVTGVGNANVIQTWNGPSTVKVIIVDSNNAAASDALIAATAAAIEEIRPIGATVTVVSAVEKKINITADVFGTNANVSEFEAALKKYFSIAQFGEMKILIARVGKILISTTGITDYQNLRINDQEQNITMTKEELPSIGVVNLNVIDS